MEASDKDGLSRGYGAVLWPPDDRAGWIDPARTATVLGSERSRWGHLTRAELVEQVARVARGRREPGVARFRGHPRGS
jgi:hypothetical protein